jgi:hypothetical protein
VIVQWLRRTAGRAHDPDPTIIATLHELLANGCDSPLYNPTIHISELHATLQGVRSRLITHACS